MSTFRIAAASLAVALLLPLAACSAVGDPAPADGAQPEAGASNTAESTEADPTQPVDDDAMDALDAALKDKDIVSSALETALSAKNAKVDWDGTVINVTLDGDVDSLIDPFSNCRIIGNFLEEGDTLILNFPNGSIDCADIPELEGQLIW